MMELTLSYKMSGKTHMRDRIWA